MRAGYRELEPGASEHLKCVDVNNLCADWASRGECQRNPGYMLEKCPLSCHACDEGEGRATPAAEEGLVANRLDARSSEGTVLVLTTSAGALRIRVRPAASDVAGAIQKQAPCTKCAFYRAELPADLGECACPAISVCQCLEPNRPDTANSSPPQGLPGLPMACSKGASRRRCFPPKVRLWGP